MIISSLIRFAERAFNPNKEPSAAESMHPVLEEAPGHIAKMHGNVRELNLSGKEITDHTMPDLRLYPNLEALDLSGNQLTTPPAFLTSLKKLRTLNLSENALQYPPPVGGLKALEKLNLSGNKLQDVDLTTFSLPLGCKVDLSKNRVPKTTQKEIKRTLQEYRTYEHTGPSIDLSNQQRGESNFHARSSPEIAQDLDLLYRDIARRNQPQLEPQPKKAPKKADENNGIQQKFYDALEQAEAYFSLATEETTTEQELADFLTDPANQAFALIMNGRSGEHMCDFNSASKIIMDIAEACRGR